MRIACVLSLLVVFFIGCQAPFSWEEGLQPQRAWFYNPTTKQFEIVSSLDQTVVATMRPKTLRRRTTTLTVHNEPFVLTEKGFGRRRSIHVLKQAAELPLLTISNIEMSKAKLVLASGTELSAIKRSSRLEFRKEGRLWMRLVDKHGRQQGQLYSATEVENPFLLEVIGLYLYKDMKDQENNAANAISGIY